MPIFNFFTIALLFVNQFSFAIPDACKELTPREARAIQRQLGSLPPELQSALLIYVQKLLRIPMEQAIADGVISADEILDLSQLKTTTGEKKVLGWLANQEKQGKLEPVVAQILEIAIAKASAKKALAPQVNKLKDEQKQMAQQILTAAIRSTLSLRGLLSKQTYIEWVEISKDLTRFLKNTKHLSFERALQSLLGEKTLSALEYKFFADGKIAHKNRIRMMDEAEGELNVMFWAIYDDVTGGEIAAAAVRAHRRGIKVRVIVDGQTSMRPGYGNQVKMMEEAGVEVIRWMDPIAPHLGQHMKLVLNGTTEAQGGGHNGGDPYSGINPNVAAWRDTDFYFRGGSVVLELHNVFADVWNEQVVKRGLAYSKMDRYEVPTGGNIRIIRHNPANYKEASQILKALALSIRYAEVSIDIQNAYIVTIPAIQTVIEEAVARGIPVRISTNSAESIDEPAIAIPILRSSKAMSAVGAKIFLRKGTTLHSKLAVIDRMWSFVKSYNLHPRSERLENELTFIILDRNLGEAMTSQFNLDIAPEHATPITDPSQIRIPPDPISPIGLRIFFDQI